MPTVQNNLELSCYEVYERGQIAGILKYRMESGQMWLMSTHMSAPSEGPAVVEAQAIRLVLQDLWRRKIEVLPFCPIVRQFMLKNPLFLEYLPEDPPGHFPLLREGARPLAGGNPPRSDRAAARASIETAHAEQVSPPAVVRQALSREQRQKRTVRFSSPPAAHPLPASDDDPNELVVR